MKIKTSVSISLDVLKKVDALSKPHSNRSEFIETAVRRFIEQLKKERRNADDLAIINRNYKRLNQEASAVLEYQALK
jgi:metal-responsive CopG/Arc/MetJ family transcriptional regulator